MNPYFSQNRDSIPEFGIYDTIDRFNVVRLQRDSTKNLTAEALERLCQEEPELGLVAKLFRQELFSNSYFTCYDSISKLGSLAPKAIPYLALGAITEIMDGSNHRAASYFRLIAKIGSRGYFEDGVNILVYIAVRTGMAVPWDATFGDALAIVNLCPDEFGTPKVVSYLNDFLSAVPSIIIDRDESAEIFDKVLKTLEKVELGNHKDKIVANLVRIGSLKGITSRPNKIASTLGEIGVDNEDVRTFLKGGLDGPAYYREIYRSALSKIEASSSLANAALPKRPSNLRSDPKWFENN